MKKYLLALFFATLCSLAFAQTARKTAVAVMDLRGSGLSETDAKFLTERLIIELQRTDVFDVLERDKMSEILKEQGFQQTGACDQTSCLVEAGRMLPVQKMIGGSVGKLGETFSVQIRLIDLRTARVEKTATQDCNQKMDYLLTNGMNDVANELIGKPRHSNDVAKAETKIPNIVNKDDKLYFDPVYYLSSFKPNLYIKGARGDRYYIDLPDSIKNQLRTQWITPLGMFVPGIAFYASGKTVLGSIELAALTSCAIVVGTASSWETKEAAFITGEVILLGGCVGGMVCLNNYNKKILGKYYKLALNVCPDKGNIKTVLALNF